MAMAMGEQGTNLSHSVRATIKEGSQRTTTLTDDKKRDYENEGSTMHEDSCNWHQLRSRSHVPKVFQVTSHCWVSLCTSCRQF